MRFVLTDEQRAFADSLDAMLTSADTPTAARAWAGGDPAPGLALWSRLAEAGVFALAAPDAYEGVGPLPVELAVAFVELGRHAVPGPVVETVAAAALLTRLAELGDTGPAKRLLPGLATGDSTATVALAGEGPYALDADRAGTTLVVEGAGPDARPGNATGESRRSGAAAASAGNARVRAVAGSGDQPGANRDSGAGAASAGNARVRAVAGSGDQPGANRDSDAGAIACHPADSAGPAKLDRNRRAGDADARATRVACLRVAHGHRPVRVSADPVRRLAVPAAGGEVLAEGVHVARAAAYALDVARLVTAAQALGVGVALLDRTVAYVKQRTQFGTAIGSFQTVKHRLADTLIGLEFARPLLYGAALSMAPADIAAAKVSAGEAAYAAARTALQLHGAVGYTEELDLSLWLRKARPLRDAWGTPAACRARVLAD